MLGNVMKKSLTFMMTMAVAGVVSLGAVKPSFAIDPLVLLGVKQPEDPNIKYKPRAPLVMPPEVRLQAPRSAATERGAEWPNDPDEQIREFEEAAKVALSKQPRSTPRESGDVQVMSPRALDQWASNAGKRGRDSGNREDETRMLPRGEGASRAFTPEELKAGATADGVPIGYVEPERLYLTDPPTGLRAAAAGSEVPQDPSEVFYRRGSQERDFAGDFKPN